MKTCRQCGKPFNPHPSRALASLCSPRCAVAMAKAREQDRKAKDRDRLEELKPLRKLLTEAQRTFNAFIRERDRSLPCISCGRHHGGAWDAGHYLTTKARPDLRFDEANVHRQCVPCNQFLSGNVVEYRKRLVRRIGVAELERLEGPPTRGKYTRDEVAALKTTYAAKTRELVKGRT